MNTMIQRLLQSLINQCLRLDEELPELLQDIQGRTVLLSVRGSNMRYLLQVHTDGISVRSMPDGYREEPDVRIESSLSGIFSLLFDARGAELPGDMRIVGDVTVLQGMKRALSNFSPDWQEPLSRVIGDAATHRAGLLVGGLRKRLHHGGRHLLKDLGNYLHYEKQLLPDAREVERFHSEVDDLRSDVDRLELRLRKLTGKRKIP